jgi:hypothetical protein
MAAADSHEGFAKLMTTAAGRAKLNRCFGDINKWKNFSETGEFCRKS